MIQPWAECNYCYTASPATPSPLGWRIEHVTKSETPDHVCTASTYQDATGQWYQCDSNNTEATRQCVDWQPTFKAILADDAPVSGMFKTVTCQLANDCDADRSALSLDRVGWFITGADGGCRQDFIEADDGWTRCYNGHCCTLTEDEVLELEAKIDAF